MKHGDKAGKGDIGVTAVGIYRKATSFNVSSGRLNNSIRRKEKKLSRIILIFQSIKKQQSNLGKI
eukprot:snap_masked-scaffold_22-processed-gene-1.13-mRNA-1 protein AED:1.00 eAED:1.00 QI:0/0/0/0/1/1/2/0/64